MKFLNSDKFFFDFSNYSTKSNNTKKLVIGKMKEKTAGVAIEEFVRLKLKMHLLLVGSSVQKKQMM